MRVFNLKYASGASLTLIATMLCAGACLASPQLDSDMDEHGWRVSPTVTTAAAPSEKEVRKSGSSPWLSLGPFGGDIEALAASPLVPGLVLAGTAPPVTAGALYRSVDGGDSWTRLANIEAAIFDIEFADDGSVFVGTSTGLFEGNEQGTEFSARDLGIGINQPVVDVHLVRDGSNKIWVAVANPFGQVPASLMRSSDGGFSWVDATPPIPAGFGGTAVAVDSNDSDRVLAAFSGDFGGGALWASDNGGQTWVDRSSGLPAGRPLFSIVHDGSRFLVGGGRPFGGQLVGLYTTSNMGAQWNALHSGNWPLLAVNEIALDPNQPGVIIVASPGAGIYRSADGGQTWQLGIGGTASLSVSAARFVASSSDTILIGTEARGVFRSTDAGAAFLHASNGILEVRTTTVSANPQDELELAVGFSGENSGGVLRSIDGGQTWLSEAVPPTRYTAVAHAADGTLYAISDGPTTIAPEGLYRRESNGSWMSLGPDQGPNFESKLDVIAFDPQQPQTLLLGGADRGMGNDATIWRTSDGGATWSKRFESSQSGEGVIDLAFAGGDVVIAAHEGFAQSQAGGMLRSVNRGLDWERANDGLPTYARQPRVCRSAGGDLWLAAWRELELSDLYRSQNQGATWERVLSSLENIRDIACDPNDMRAIYFALRGSPWIIRTRDSAATFEVWGDGIDSLGDGLVQALVPTHGRLLLASPRGVFQSSPLDRVFVDGFEAP